MYSLLTESHCSGSSLYVVAGCCTRTEYPRLFNRRVAAKDARRYRSRGLSGTARTLTELAGDVSEATVLEVGGGIGAIQLELLAAGADRATSVEISDAYEIEAEKLLTERGLTGRVERRIGDFVAEGASIEQHDIVVMHRVVCCYPDVDALVGEAAVHAGRVLLVTYPQGRWAIRAGVRAVNVFLRLSRCGFRTYAHPLERIAAAGARHGLTLETRARDGLIWESAALARR
jgi:2-polyprenyl-3-methyl-5-hydroxy-6-metoxy-1,4-benzoquinol methylase